MNLKVALFTLCLGAVTVPHVFSQECNDPDPEAALRASVEAAVVAALETTAPAPAPVSVDPPKIDEVTKSVNMLMGLPVHQQRRLLLGKPIFDLTRKSGVTDRSTKGYNMFEEIGQFSRSENCVVQSSSSETYWAMSESSFHAQSSSSSTGFDMTVDFGVSFMDLGEASSSIHNSLVYGNSDSSITTRSMSSMGKSRSYHEMATRDLYSVKVEHEEVAKQGSWTDEFKDALKDLTNDLNNIVPPNEFDEYNDPYHSRVLTFFKTYGTHGLSRAYFGQMCSSSLYMAEGGDKDTYDSIVTEVSTKQSGFLWWSSSETTSQTSSNHKDTERNIEYSVSNKECIGNLAANSTCESLRGTRKDVPEILRWSVLALWDMPFPQEVLPLTAKAKMKSAFEHVMKLASECSVKHCSGKGSCAPNLKPWVSPGGKVEQRDLFHENQCFCREGIEGEFCNVYAKECNPVNVALNKPVTGTPEYDDRHPIIHAVDGNPSAAYYGNTASNPWFKVDLKGTYRIKDIRFHVLECHFNKFVDLEIYQKDVSQFKTRIQILTDENGDIDLDPIIIPDEAMVMGDSVKVTVDSTENDCILKIYEVEVYGCGWPDSDAANSNVALGKPVWQSSTAYSSPAELAVDGNTDGDHGHGSVTHTEFENTPRWRVDLQAKYFIDEVVIWNRDSYQDRLKTVVVEVFKDGGVVPNGQYKHSGETPPRRLAIPFGVVGDWVKIYIPGDDKVLSLAEVEVMGYPW